MIWSLSNSEWNNLETLFPSPLLSMILLPWNRRRMLRKRKALIPVCRCIVAIVIITMIRLRYEEVLQRQRSCRTMIDYARVRIWLTTYMHLIEAVFRCVPTAAAHEILLPTALQCWVMSTANGSYCYYALLRASVIEISNATVGSTAFRSIWHYTAETAKRPTGLKILRLNY